MNKKENYQICNRCIMDTTDPNIEFDDNGNCNHCNRSIQILNNYPFNLSKKNKEKEFFTLIKNIKNSSKNKEYDCVIGISGGVDSTYIAFLCKKLGLKPLAVHFDNGWNSELAVKNIESAMKKFDIDLFTYVLDWSEFRDLQLSFLKASVPDLEIPTDHMIPAILYKMAAKYNIKYIIDGQNYTSESILPKVWSYGHLDWRYIRDIQKRFGTKKLKKIPHFSIFSIIYYQIFLKIKEIHFLDYIDYDKEAAIKELEKTISWKRYEGKHCESTYTKFIQSYILPNKFNFDKRRAHLSSLICSNQISRDKALLEMKKKSYDEKTLKSDIRYFCDKLEISEKKFNYLMKLPNKFYTDYNSYDNSNFYNFLKFIYKKFFINLKK